MIDKDLALAVLENFNNGFVVNEDMLVKAAESLNFSPREILKEARLRTVITDFLEKKAGDYKNYLALACGISKERLEKIAILQDSLPELVAIEYLRAQNFTPHEKLAQMDDGSSAGQNLQQNPALLQNALLSNDPFGNVMYQPSPTAPAQVPPNEEGNFGQLLNNYDNQDEMQAQQQQLGADQMLQQASQEEMQQQPGMQPTYSKEQIQQALMQADAQGKAKYVMPGGTPEQLERLSTEIAKIEQQTGIPISDPAQLKKVMQGIEKQEKAIIDQAIQANFETGQQEATGPLPGPAGQTQQTPPSQDPSAMQKMAYLMWLVKRK
jgi:Tfp pilus assembly protein PilV